MKINNISKNIFVLGLGLLLSVGAVAQDQQADRAKKQMTPAEHQEKMLENYKKNLNLSDAQGKQLQAINQKMVTDMQAVRNDQHLNRDQKQERMKALQASRQQQIVAILNADQKQKFDALEAKKSERKHNMHEKRRGGMKNQMN